MARRVACLSIVSVLLGTSFLVLSTAVCAVLPILPLSSVFELGHQEGTERHPIVVYNPDVRQYLVVWSCASTKGNGADIWAERISWEGESRGDLVLVCGADGDQLLPDVSYCPLSGEYLVVWQDHRAGGAAAADVYARRVSADGRLIGDELSVAAAAGDQLRPQIAYNVPAEQYLIVWQNCGDNGDGCDVFGRWLVADGGMAGDDFAISDADGGQCVPVVVADLSRPRCLVAWEDSRHASWKHEDIYARFVAPSNLLDGPELPIATSPGPEYSPHVGYNPVVDEYLILWEDEIGGQRLTGEGEPVAASFWLFRATPYLRKPALFADADSGDWVMVWEDLHEMGLQDVDIYARWLSEGENSLADAVLLHNHESNQFAPAVAYNSYRGEFLVVWNDGSLGDGSLTIRGRRFALVP